MVIKNIYLNYYLDSVSERSAYSVVIEDINGDMHEYGEIFDLLDDTKLSLLATLTAFRHLSKSNNMPGITTNIYLSSKYVYDAIQGGRIYKWEKSGHINKIDNNDLLWAILIQIYKTDPKWRMRLIDKSSINDNYCRKLLNLM